MKIQHGLVYAVIASILWALAPPFVKSGLSSGVPVMNFAGVRFTIVGILLLAYSWRGNTWSIIVRERKLLSLLVLVNMFAGYGAYYIGIDMTSAAISSIVVGMSPMINVLLGHFMAKNDRLNLKKIISLIFSAAGLCLIIGIGGRGGTSIDMRTVIGMLLLLTSMLLQGYVAIRISEHKRTPDPILLNGVQMLLGGLMIYLFAIATEGLYDITAMSKEFYISLAVLVSISLFAFSLWFKALQMKDSKFSEINMCRLICPVLGVAVSWLLIPDESPSLSTVGGVFFLVISLLIYFRDGGFRRKDNRNVMQ